MDYAGDYMERQSIDLSLFARQRLYKNFFIEGMVGRAFGRSYKQYAGDQKVSFAIPLVTFGDDRTAKKCHLQRRDDFYAETDLQYEGA